MIIMMMMMTTICRARIYPYFNSMLTAITSVLLTFELNCTLDTMYIPALCKLRQFHKWYCQTRSIDEDTVYVQTDVHVNVFCIDMARSARWVWRTLGLGSVRVSPVAWGIKAWMLGGGEVGERLGWESRLLAEDISTLSRITGRASFDQAVRRTAHHTVRWAESSRLPV